MSIRAVTCVIFWDNLLRRGSPEEIQAVMGHEMGHYVLHHVYWGTLSNAILFVLFFALLQGSLNWAIQRWGEKWQVRGCERPCGFASYF